MNKHYLLSLLIFLLTNFHYLFRASVSLEVLAKDNLNTNIIVQQNLTFKEYLDLGYEDLENQNYQEALIKFNAGLKLNPDNKEVQQAIIRTQGYIYDDNMNKGYQATKNREYEQALNYFRIAAQQRPDDFYSLKAINNVEKLLEKQGKSLQSQLSIFLIVIFILLIIIIIVLVLISMALRVAPLNQASSAKSQESLPQSEPMTKSSESINISPVSEAQSNKSVNNAVKQQFKRNNYLPANLTLTSSSSSSQRKYALSITSATVLGRSPECNIVLNPNEFTTVSRFHARIELVETDNQVNWQITDNNSTNGTFVNGEKIISPRILHSDDLIRLGGLKGPEFIFATEPLNPTVLDHQIKPESDTPLHKSESS